MSDPGPVAGVPPAEPASSEEIAPSERELERARAAFEVGDYHLVREIATVLARDGDAKVRAAAEALLARIRVDPFAKWIGIATLLVLLFVTYWYVFR